MGLHASFQVVGQLGSLGTHLTQLAATLAMTRPNSVVLGTRTVCAFRASRILAGSVFANLGEWVRSTSEIRSAPRWRSA